MAAPSAVESALSAVSPKGEFPNTFSRALARASRKSGLERNVPR